MGVPPSPLTSTPQAEPNAGSRSRPCCRELAVLVCESVERHWRDEEWRRERSPAARYFCLNCRHIHEHPGAQLPLLKCILIVAERSHVGSTAGVVTVGHGVHHLLCSGLELAEVDPFARSWPCTACHYCGRWPPHRMPALAVSAKLCLPRECQSNAASERGRHPAQQQPALEQAAHKLGRQQL